MKRITFVLALLLLCVGQLAYAQTIKVTGTVTDAADGQPLTDVGVMVKGTTNGVVTDLNGQYVINVRRDAVLVFKMQGYTDQEVAVNGRSVINVALSMDATQLEDVIVVGYGTGRKISTVVGSAQTVKATTLKDRPSRTSRLSMPQMLFRDRLPVCRFTPLQETLPQPYQ